MYICLTMLLVAPSDLAPGQGSSVAVRSPPGVEGEPRGCDMYSAVGARLIEYALCIYDRAQLYLAVRYHRYVPQVVG